MLHERRGWIRERKDQENTMGLIQTSALALFPLPGAVQRYRVASSSWALTSSSLIPFHFCLL
jgi:hypothetical protein